MGKETADDPPTFILPFQQTRKTFPEDGNTTKVSGSPEMQTAGYKLQKMTPPKNEKDIKVSGGPMITLLGTVITGCMGLAASVLLANTRNYLKPPKGKGSRNL